MLSGLAPIVRFYLVAAAVIVVPAIGIWFLMRRMLRCHLNWLPSVYRWPVVWQFLEGLVWAALLLTLSIGPGWLAGGFSVGVGYERFAYLPDSAPQVPYAQLWLMFFAQSLFEEALFRGVGMALLLLLVWRLTIWVAQPTSLAALNLGSATPADAMEQDAQRQARAWRAKAWWFAGLLANIVVAVAFGWVHARNPHVTPLAIANVALAGLVLGQLFLHRGTIIGVWALHWLWNSGQAILGLPVSGVTFNPAGSGVTHGARTGILTGGTFGPEGSLPNTIAMSLALAILLWLSWRKWWRSPAQDTRRPVSKRGSKS